MEKPSTPILLIVKKLESSPLIDQLIPLPSGSVEANVAVPVRVAVPEITSSIAAGASPVISVGGSSTSVTVTVTVAVSVTLESVA